MHPVNVGAAFLAGLASFLSPCVLPLVPGYISFMSGLSIQELSSGGSRPAAERRAALTSLAFVLGFSVVFTALGASASGIGRLLAAHMGVLSRAAGALVMLLSLQMYGLISIPWLQYTRRADISRVPPGLAGAFLVGLAFAFGWTPCIGPLLAAILALAATRGTVAQGAALLFVYSLGLGIPFILTGLGLNAFLRFFARYKHFLRFSELAAATLLMAVGLMMFTQRMSWLLRLLPHQI